MVGSVARGYHIYRHYSSFVGEEPKCDSEPNNVIPLL